MQGWTSLVPTCLELLDRSTPHATMGVAPCTLFMQRQICTRFDLLRPDREGRVEEKQAQQKANHDERAHHREWSPGKHVMARNLRPGDPWVPAVITTKLGPVTYTVRTTEGKDIQIS